RSRALHVYRDDDGMFRLRGRLEPEVGELLMQALAVSAETRVVEMPVENPPTFERQQADALALLAETALHHGIDPGAPGERYQVVVHVDAPALADPMRPASPCSTTANTFPRKRPGAWPATLAAW